jgi:acyl carrier protein
LTRFSILLALCQESVLQSSDLRDDLGMDSLDIVTFQMSTEELFNPSIPDEKTEGLPRTIGDAVSVVYELMNG